MSEDKLPDDVRQFLIAEHKNELIKDGDITVAQAAELWHVSDNAAIQRLKNMVSEGKLTKHVGILRTGFRGTFYRIVE